MCKLNVMSEEEDALTSFLNKVDKIGEMIALCAVWKVVSELSSWKNC